MSKFEFHYEVNENLSWDDDIERSVNRQRWKEKEYFEKYGGILDKTKIPSGTYCNNEEMCCPYCVSDCCLLYGGRMESKLGYYGFSFQKRKKRCVEEYPKGKNMAQIVFDMKGGVQE